MLREEFSKAVKRAKGISANAFIDAIIEERPELADKMTYTPDQGSCSCVVKIDDNFYKTASLGEEEAPGYNEYIINAIVKEFNVLKHFEGRGLRMPEVTYEGKNFMFFGMTQIPGRMLDDEDVLAMPGPAQDKLAKDIAAHCAKLSAGVSAEEAKTLGVDRPPPNFVFQPARYHAGLARPEVQEMFGEHYGFYKNAVEQYIEFHEKKYADGKKYFMHADLQPANIFFDPETDEFQGFIDYGVSRMTWPEEGFVNLAMLYPQGFAHRVLEEYSRLQPVPVTQKDTMLWMCVRVLMNVSISLETGQREKRRKMLQGLITSVRKKTEPLLQAGPSSLQMQTINPVRKTP